APMKRRLKASVPNTRSSRPPKMRARSAMELPPSPASALPSLRRVAAGTPASPAMNRKKVMRPKASPVRANSTRLLIAASSAQRRLRRRQPGDRHAVGRAGHVIQFQLLEEANGSRVAAMLARNAELDARPDGASAIGAHFHQRPYALHIERHERVLAVHTLAQIIGHESG